MKIYVICPVRNCKPDRKLFADEYVAKLETDGNKVHYPPRDANQIDDGIGFNICNTHRDAMLDADEVHVIWDADSKGSHFDLGMAFILQEVRSRGFEHLTIKYVEKPTATPNKSYTNLLIHITDNPRLV